MLTDVGAWLQDREGPREDDDSGMKVNGRQPDRRGAILEGVADVCSAIRSTIPVQGSGNGGGKPRLAIRCCCG